MNRLVVVLGFVCLTGCFAKAEPAKQVQEEKKVCNSPDGHSDITVCDFGGVVTIYGKGWGNSFRKIDLVPPQPQAQPEAGAIHKKKNKKEE